MGLQSPLGLRQDTMRGWKEMRLMDMGVEGLNILIILDERGAPEYLFHPGRIPMHDAITIRLQFAMRMMPGLT